MQPCCGFSHHVWSSGLRRDADDRNADMKVLFSFPLPFFLAHGGSQTLIEALMRELAQLGVDVEPVRWWDENQCGDILHYIGRPTMLSVRLGHKKGFKIVMTDFLD